MFFIVQNKYTQEWEFPTGTIFFGETFLRAKQNLFVKLSGNQWRIKYYGSLPQTHTMRDFTVAEREETTWDHLKGVRTYYFHANHWRGLPCLSETITKDTDYQDFRWIPKRQLNDYFTEEYYKVFIHGLTTR